MTTTEQHLTIADVTAYVARATDEDGVDYFDWSVMTADGRVLAQDRSEIEDGEPTREDLERFLRITLGEEDPYA